jgi:WD40 repeat protein
MENKKKTWNLAISLAVIAMMLPGVMTDVWDFISPAKSLEEFEPVKVAYTDSSLIYIIAFSPDRNTVVTGSSGYLKFWNITAAAHEYKRYSYVNDGNGFSLDSRQPYPYRIVSDLEFSQSGKYFLSVSHDDDGWPSVNGPEGSYLTIYTEHPHSDYTSKELRSHQINDTFIKDCAFSPDESTYVACTEMISNPEKCVLTFWDVKSGDIINSITSDDYEPTSIAFTPNGKYLVVSFDNSLNPDRIVVFDIETGEIQKIINEKAVSHLQFSDDGTIFAAGSTYRSEVIVWNGTSYEEMHRLQGLDLPPDSTALSSDGKYVMGMDFRRLIIWDTDSKRKIVSSRHLKIDYISSFKAGSFSDDGKYIAVGACTPSDSKYSNPHLNPSGMVFVYDFEEILESYYS